MNTRRPGISKIWPPARGRHRATMVEGSRHRGDRESRAQWMPALAASRERLVGSAVLSAVGRSS